MGRQWRPPLKHQIGCDYVLYIDSRLVQIKRYQVFLKPHAAANEFVPPPRAVAANSCLGTQAATVSPACPRRDSETGPELNAPPTSTKTTKRFRTDGCRKS
eukprot:9485282-Pyramimonas_sp.AAC.1